MNKFRIVIVSPAKNEASNIENFLSELKQFHLKIVLVDDGSTDSTLELAQKYTPHVLHHLINLGKGAALKTGCEYAFRFLKADSIIMIDSDGQHLTSELPFFLKKLQRQKKLILGIRKGFYKMPVIRKFLNILLSQAIYLIYGVYIPDILSGYKAFSREVYDKVQWNGNGYEVEMQIALAIAQQKIPFEHIPITTIYHKHDKGMSILDALFVTLKLILHSAFHKILSS